MVGGPEEDEEEEEDEGDATDNDTDVLQRDDQSKSDSEDTVQHRSAFRPGMAFSTMDQT